MLCMLLAVNPGYLLAKEETPFIQHYRSCEYKQ